MLHIVPWRAIAWQLSIALVLAPCGSVGGEIPWVRVTCEIEAKDFTINYRQEDSIEVVQELSSYVALSCKEKFYFLNWTYIGDMSFLETADYELLLSISDDTTGTEKQINLVWHDVKDTGKFVIPYVEHRPLYTRRDANLPTHDPDALISKVKGVLNELFSSTDFPYDISYNYLSRIVLANDIHLSDTLRHLRQLVIPLEWSRLGVARSAVFKVVFTGVPPLDSQPLPMEIFLSNNYGYPDSEGDSVMSEIEDFSCRDWRKQEEDSWFVELKKVLGSRVEGSLNVYLLKFYPDSSWGTSGGHVTRGPGGGQQ